MCCFAAIVRTLPGLVSVKEIETLKEQLAEVADGKRFLLQGGDCAERFQDCQADLIEKKLKIMIQMSLVLVWGARIPTVRVARMAGQFAKPRSSDTEILDGGMWDALTLWDVLCLANVSHRYVMPQPNRGSA